MDSKSQKPEDIEELVRSKVRNIPDYPVKGVVFRDITPLLKDPIAFNRCIRELSKRVQSYDFDYIAGIEARGFIIGAALAYDNKKGFIPIRKKGHLPSDKLSMEYELEYGRATLEVHKDSLEPGSKVLIVDDIIATGGSAVATKGLILGLGAHVSAYAFVLELSALNGRKNLGTDNVASIVKY